MKKTHLISPLYLLSLLKSASSQGGTPQPNSPRDLFAGYWINFENQKNCTASFVVNKQGINGLLTSARCCVNNNCLNGNVFDTAYENEDDGNVTKIGQVHDAQFGGDNGLDYAFVTLDSIDWKPFHYTAGLTYDNGSMTELYPVIADFAPTELGIPICASGQSSGYLCGNLTELNLDLVVTNPWTGRPTILKGINKVDLGKYGFESSEDLGGPVYVKTDKNGTTTSQALGHMVATNNDDPQHKFLYYLPIEKVLTAANTELLTYQEEEKIDDFEIKYSEWNDTIDVNAVDPNNPNTYIYAGNRISVENENSPYRTVCTTNFAVGKDFWTNGILTSGRCDESLRVGPNVFLGGTNKRIGYINRVENGGKKQNKDYAFITPNQGVNPMPCIAVPNKEGTRDYLAVTSATTPWPFWTFITTEVCLVGASSGWFYCGEVIGLDETITYSREGKKYTMTGLGKVKLKGYGAIPNGDIGGPVFIKDSGTTARAIGHVFSGGLSPYWENNWWHIQYHVFYVPIAETLKAQNIELKTTKVCPTTQGQQQAQIEIPPKK
jgi:hypothetical protein